MGKTIQLAGFPPLVKAETVKKFLEIFTGQGSVYAVEVKQSKKGNGLMCPFVKVQFTTDFSAEKIIFLTKSGSQSRWSNFKAFGDLDDIQKPKAYALEMESVTLYFGCQISTEKFSMFWQRDSVNVKFGFGIRKLYFFLSYLSAEYRLDLSYENIWQIELRRPHGQSAEFLVIQLLGAPRIYKKHGGSVFSFFKETPEDHWLRATDFTPSCCIGHSSALCLEFPLGTELPNISQYFAYYKETEGPFSLESGSTFSENSNLVPILVPPQGIKLPYKILFKVNSLVQQGCLPGPALDSRFFQSVDPDLGRTDIVLIEHALEKLYNLKECCYEPVKWLEEHYRKRNTSKRPRRAPSFALDEGLVYVHRVLITPCKVYFNGPEVNMSNRVLRNYLGDIDNFLRVSFVDEEFGKMYSTDLSPRVDSSNKKTGIYDRILSVLRDGIVIGDKKFEFLAFSSSQVRENSTWMFASRPGLTAADIRMWMGDFSRIRNVAKYAARLGQSFSSSTETLSVARDEIENIPDVRNGTEYVFSDGIGKISADFAQQIARKCSLKGTPSAFQIRYGGYKGVVAVDPMSSVKMSLRESMCKYESLNIKLDVLAWSRHQPCFLNRQLISLLSTLGVKDHVFEEKQKEEIDKLNTILTDPLRAQDALELMSPGENTSILKELLLCGYKPDAEPFLSMMLQTFRAAKLLDLRTKTRIFIPNGRSMMGCLDETRTLEYGQIFVQCSSAGRMPSCDGSLMPCTNGSDRRKFVVKGKVVVAKNPCLHPGDVRVLTAIDAPDLYHMVDCVVFPQKGMRPHPNECSGSDLDGDIYFVCWDPDLIPAEQKPPMDYTAAPSMVLDHEVTIEEIGEYFANYIINDSLGVIANAHTVFADREPLKAMSNPCIELARLFSIAVDFPKTGVPAQIPPNLRVKKYPDFMEKPDKLVYTSDSVIGKLFRAVRDISPNSSPVKSFFTRNLARKSYDPDMEVYGFKDYVDEAVAYKREYDFELGNLMDHYGIKTEAEILSGNVIKMSRNFDRRRDTDPLGSAVRSLRKKARTWFNETGSASDYVAGDLYAKASAWYHVTYHPSFWGRYNEGLNRDHFLSFPWCVYEKLVIIKKDKVRTRRALQMSTLEQEFGYGLSLNQTKRQKKKKKKNKKKTPSLS